MESKFLSASVVSASAFVLKSKIIISPLNGISIGSAVVQTPSSSNV